MAQVWVHEAGTFKLSDKLFWCAGSALTLLYLDQKHDPRHLGELEMLLQKFDASRVVSPVVISIATKRHGESVTSTSHHSRQAYACTEADLTNNDMKPIQGYDASSLNGRLAAPTRYALVRSDFIIFSQAATTEELVAQLQRAKELIMPERNSS